MSTKCVCTLYSVLSGHDPHSPAMRGWRLPPRHRRPPKKTALGWHSYASRQSDAHQLRRQSLQCSWTSSLELSACSDAGPHTAGLVIWFIQSLNAFLFGQRDHSGVQTSFHCALEMLLLTYLLGVCFCVQIVNVGMHRTGFHYLIATLVCYCQLSRRLSHAPPSAVVLQACVNRVHYVPS